MSESDNSSAHSSAESSSASGKPQHGHRARKKSGHTKSHRSKSAAGKTPAGKTTGGKSTGRKAAESKNTNKKRRNRSQVLVQIVPLKDRLPKKNEEMTHNNFIMMVFNIQRVAVAFSRYILGKVFSPRTLALLDFDRTTVSTLVFYNRRIRKKNETDLVFNVPLSLLNVDLSFCVMVEHKSWRDKHLPLQTNQYAIMAYSKEYDEQVGRNESVCLTPIVQAVLSHTKEGSAQPEFMDLFSAYPPEMLEELKPFLDMPRNVPINVYDLDIENVPEFEPVPELKAALMAIRDIWDTDFETTVSKVLKIISDNQNLYENSDEGVEMAQQIMQYFDSHHQNVPEDKLIDLEKEFYTNMGKTQYQGHYVRRYNEGYDAGVITGEQIGEQNRGHKSIILILNTRFGYGKKAVSKELEMRIRSLVDPSVIDSYTIQATNCSSLEEFVQSLP